jgi:hypothetical protein
MTKVLITYNRKYQEPAGNCIRSIQSCGGDVYAIVSSDVDKLYKGVEYIKHDPNMYHCNFPGCEINSDIVYNYIFAIDLLPTGKYIIMGVDQIAVQNLERLYSFETADSGIAAISIENYKRKKNPPTVGYMMKNFSDNTFKEYSPEAEGFAGSSMVIDTEKIKDCKGHKLMVAMLRAHKMSEMAAFNAYANGDFIKIPKKWAVSANYEKSDDIGTLDWHGEKPWKGKRPYQAYWDMYNV